MNSTVDDTLARLNETLDEIERTFERIDQANRVSMEKCQVCRGGTVVRTQVNLHTPGCHDWIKENAHGGWQNSGNWLWFEAESDATAFLLRWG